ncbi:protein MIZU-KUSSEI 1-like [Nymphaea colorata]|uniref:Protein MIZU-KUSSEI 1 n=1 Tax=Nymphaea colorata TaxID=210225 RepID=A0A5K1EFY4_9MAGN|nr:protein MIZU-KUSSEI 1-like [Nymphaea colorata]
MQRPAIYRRSTSRSSRITTSEESSSFSPISNTSPSQKSPAPTAPSPTSLAHLLRFSLVQCCSPASTATIPATTPSFLDSSPDDRPSFSGTIVTGTIYGHRRGYIRLCLQQDRLATAPPLLLHLAIPTKLLAQEMSSGIVRIALECNRQRDGSRDDSGGEPPLHAVPIWTTFCNGRRFGFAVQKRLTEKDRLVLNAVQSTSVGAGAIPSEDGEVMYLRAGFRRVVGSSDSESYHLINPDEAGGQELSIFLLRTG